jgi:hypothetical protein
MESRIFEVKNRNGQGVAPGSVSEVVYEIGGSQIEDVWPIGTNEVVIKIAGYGVVSMDIRNGSVKEWAVIQGEVKDIVRVNE